MVQADRKEIPVERPHFRRRPPRGQSREVIHGLFAQSFNNGIHRPVSCHEDDTGGRAYFPEFLQDLEAVTFWHSEINNGQVIMCGSSRCDGLFTVGDTKGLIPQ